MIIFYIFAHRRMVQTFKTILFCLNILGLLIISKAQQTDITAEYLKAKDLLISERYDESIKIFTELSNNTTSDDFSATCKYYASYGFYKKGNLRDANFLLFQVINRFPEWNKIDLAYYLKGVVQFEGKNYADALLQFSKISSRSYKKKAAQAERYFSDKIQADTLFQLSQKFADDKILAEVLEQKTGIAPKKSEWNVAVLLPFESVAKSRFVYELYNGMVLAADSLNLSGAKINIHPFETGKDSAGIANFTSLPGAECFDLIIGPLYTSQQKQIDEFSLKYGIPVVNPLSNVFTAGVENPNYFLFHPSSETMGKSAARFAFSNFTRKPTSVVIYDSNLSDSLMAAAYKAEFEQQGGTVLIYRMLDKNISGYFGAVMAKTVIDSVGHVFIAGSNPSLAANVFSTLESLLLEKASAYKETLINKMKEDELNKNKKDPLVEEPKKLSVADVPVLVPSKWLDIETISIQQFVLHNTHFITTDYYSAVNLTFERNYFDKTQLPPTHFSRQGYALMQTFGSYLKNYGSLFPNLLTQSSLIKSSVSTTLDFSKSRDNGFVQIVKIDNLQLKPVNTTSLNNAE